MKSPEQVMGKVFSKPGPSLTLSCGIPQGPFVMLAFPSHRVTRKCLFTQREKRDERRRYKRILSTTGLVNLMTLPGFLTDAWVRGYLQECGLPPNDYVSGKLHHGMCDNLLLWVTFLIL